MKSQRFHRLTHCAYFKPTAKWGMRPTKPRTRGRTVTAWLRSPVDIPKGRRLRVLVYARFSTDEQNPSSIDDQVAYCRRFLESLGIHDAEITVLSDEGVSGELVSRPGINEVLAGATEGRHHQAKGPSCHPVRAGSPRGASHGSLYRTDRTARERQPLGNSFPPSRLTVLSVVRPHPAVGSGSDEFGALSAGIATVVSDADRNRSSSQETNCFRFRRSRKPSRPIVPIPSRTIEEGSGTTA